MSNFDNIGWDSEGMYHDPELRLEQYREVIDQTRPYRWAGWLQDSIIEYSSMTDYTMGKADRDDLAQDILNQQVEENALTAEESQRFLHYWRRMYGGLWAGQYEDGRRYD